MQIKRRTLLAYAVVAALGGTAAYGQDASEVLIGQLEDQGFRIVLIENTWLGRIRILAEKIGGTREIVLNPNTGEILRDLWTASARGGSSGKSAKGSGEESDAGSGTGSGTGGSSGSGSGSGGNSGSGSDHDSDDDEEDDDSKDSDDSDEDESEDEDDEDGH